MKTKKELTEIEIQCLCGIKQRISLPEDFDRGLIERRNEALKEVLEIIEQTRGMIVVSAVNHNYPLDLVMNKIKEMIEK